MTGNIYQIVKACIEENDLIAPFDKVLLGVSGGKDSMTCLSVLNTLSKELNFQLGCCFVAFPMSELSGEIIDFIEELNVPFYKVGVAESDKRFNCNNCARWRRRALLECAEREGFGKIALAHNYEDNAETVLLNLFTGKGLEQLAPMRVYFGKYGVIRPMLYVREKKILSFVRRHKIPVCENKCEKLPDCGRIKIREILKDLNDRYPKIYENILK